METKVKINKLRSTVFPCKRLEIDEDNIPLFMQAMSDTGLFPTVETSIRIKVDGSENIQTQKVYILVFKRLNEDVKVTIGDERFDIESVSEENPREFSEFANRIWDKIRETVGIRYSRVALGMETETTWSETTWNKLFDRYIYDGAEEFFFRKNMPTTFYFDNKNVNITINGIFELKSNKDEIERKATINGFDFNSKVEENDEKITEWGNSLMSKCALIFKEFIVNPDKMVRE